jgi:hypothetical protein
VTVVVMIDCEAVVVDDFKIRSQDEGIIYLFLTSFAVQLGGRAVVGQRIHLEDLHVMA